MDYDSPDVMKDFPGLYATELSKKCKDDSDYSDDTTKNETLIGRKKDKKDKKDKDRGYAALEGESSGDENSKSRSPSKYKKTKSFKFSSKSKERRDKSREKDSYDKKKDKDKKLEKKIEKEKGKVDKHKKTKFWDENCNLADILPIFGVNLEVAVDRSKCHDGIDIPLPVRQCIDYLEVAGISFEGVYKVSGTKSKVLQIRKMFNNRETVNLFDYDVPTSTSLIKMFLRELPEPLFTNDLLIRFEEAGAILSANTREKHLRILIDNLPTLNKLLLSWLLIHLDNICINEKFNKMGRNSLGASLNHTFHVSSRLLIALIHHSRALFPELVLIRYIPPVLAGGALPSTIEEIKEELAKQESLLNQLHMEMSCGCVVKKREELLWEVQRIITQLKRKLKSFQKNKETTVPHEKIEDKIVTSIKNLPTVQGIEEWMEQTNSVQIEPTSSDVWAPPSQLAENVSSKLIDRMAEKKAVPSEKVDSNFDANTRDQNFEREKSPHLDNLLLPDKLEEIEEAFEKSESNNWNNLNKAIALIDMKNKSLLKLRENLIKAIQSEHNEIEILKTHLKNKKIFIPVVHHNENLDKIMDLLQKENQILQIKKIILVRQIIEQKEICIDLRAKIELYENEPLKMK